MKLPAGAVELGENGGILPGAGRRVALPAGQQRTLRAVRVGCRQIEAQQPAALRQRREFRTWRAEPDEGAAQPRRQPEPRNLPAGAIERKHRNGARSVPPRGRYARPAAPARPRSAGMSRASIQSALRPNCATAARAKSRRPTGSCSWPRNITIGPQRASCVSARAIRRTSGRSPSSTRAAGTSRLAIPASAGSVAATPAM